MNTLIKHLLKTAVVALFVGGAVLFISPIISLANAASDSEIVNVKMPENLSPQALWGAIAFEQNCAACHGENGAGTDQGPPLIHTTYNPGHHGDEAFFRAMSSGVQQHHWPYGNMPAQPQIKPGLAEMIIKFVREVQLENGIVYRQHTMQ